MSSYDTAALSKINFSGGFPTSKDLAPSIIFLVIYILSVPIFVWRLVSKRHRALIILIRPAVFLLCRIAMLVLRAIMSKNNYGENELIAELIFVSIGYLFLIEPVVELWRRSVALAVSLDEAPKWVQNLSRLLKVAILAAVGTAIAGATSISGALKDSSKMNTVIDLRKASAILALAAAIIALIAMVLTHIHFGSDARKTIYLFSIMLCLAVVCVYRLVQIFSTDPNSKIRGAVAFWVMQMTFELLAYLGLLAISIPYWFPNPKLAEQEAEAERTRDIEAQQKRNPPQYPLQPRN